MSYQDRINKAQEIFEIAECKEQNIGYGGVTKENWQDIKVGYSHLGQHSAVHKDFLSSPNAIKEEYNSLYLELLSVGYDLEIVS